MLKFDDLQYNRWYKYNSPLYKALKNNDIKNKDPKHRELENFQGINH